MQWGEKSVHRDSASEPPRMLAEGLTIMGNQYNEGETLLSPGAIE